MQKMEENENGEMRDEQRGRNVHWLVYERREESERSEWRARMISVNVCVEEREKERRERMRVRREGKQIQKRGEERKKEPPSDSEAPGEKSKNLNRGLLQKRGEKGVERR